MAPRGPDDYEDAKEDADLRRLAHIMERMMSRYESGGPKYQEGNDKGMKGTLWGICATLVASFILGGVILGNKVSALEATVTAWQQAMLQRISANEARMDRLENRRP